MKKILLLLLLNSLLHYQNINAQTRTLDSIKAELRKHPQHDTTRLNMLVDYVLSAVNTNTSQALPFMQEVVSISKELNHQRGIELGYIYLQLYFSDRGDFAEAKRYTDTAIYYLAQDTSRYAQRNLAYLLYNHAGDNLKLGNYDEAIENYTKAAAVLEKIEPESLASVYSGLAEVYNELNQPEKIFEYDRKAIAEAEKSGEKASIARRKLNYATHYIQQGNFAEAEAILHQTEPLVTETKDAISQALFYQIQGQIHQNKKQYPQAIASFNAAYKMGVENDDKYQQIALLNPLVNTLIEAGKIQEAQSMNDTLLQKSLLYNMRFGRKNAYENASKLFLLNKDYFNAYKYLALKMQLADSISSDEVKEKANKIEIRFKVAQKDREIKALQAEKELQQLQLRQKSTLNYILIGSALAIILISLLTYRNYKQRQKIHQQRIGELETEKQLMATEAILKGEEQERSRLAKDLHDGLGGMLSGVKYSLNNMKENMVMTSDDANTFEHNIHLLNNSINEMRRVAHNLMPEALLKFGLNEALNDYCAETSKSGILKVSYMSFGLKDKTIERSLSITVYRIVQELLYNITKHANATQAIVQLSASETQLTITVEDNGIGFQKENTLPTASGIGWKNIQSRVDYYKGNISINSSPEKGTSVFIELNLI
ncbi:MAG: hypothetical protein BGO32_10670 [Bacteroidetes bacterium 37-13]|nr:MAG: hypothetical protein BGO32_10670 [Bacteroidetes bacterium 37-13]